MRQLEEGMPKKLEDDLDPLSLAVIGLTLVLFVLVLFLNGFTHDMLQVCGVFLVSVKLILMSYKNGQATRRAEERLAKIQTLLQDPGQQGA
jgi:hypothetical protein